MKYYLAPLEGITTYVYRNAYHKYFYPMTTYYTPFIVPHKEKKFNTRELKELSPEHNQGLHVVPQLLTNNAEDFLKTGKEISDMGYEEINLNLGCPSKTVVTKNKGSGFLSQLDDLERFLDDIYSKADFKISIKTRIGKESPDEFENILQIYNKFPIYELIIHPRIQTDFYKNKPNLSVFEYATKNSLNPICYNGDLNTILDISNFIDKFDKVESLMLGRGVIHNPSLISSFIDRKPVNKDIIYQFHQEILNNYIPISSGDRNVLFKMKELWFYMSYLFENADKHLKKIKKTERIAEYNSIVQSMFRDCSLRKELTEI